VTGITAVATVLCLDSCMRKLHCVLALLVAMVFGLSLAVPAEDIPDTAYDESESMPYMSALSLSLVLQESTRALRILPVGRSNSRLVLKESGSAVCPICESLNILVHSIRC